MKRFVPVIIVIAAIAIAGLSWYGYQPKQTVIQNPDPNHTHADFAVWVDGKQLDFSDTEFMSGLSTDDSTHDEEGEYHDPYLHLHDGNENVIHRHKPGLTIGGFMRSLGVKDTTEDGNLCLSFPQGITACGDGPAHRTWMMKLSTREYSETTYDYGFDYDYVFQDEDKILMILSSSEDWDEQMKEINIAWDKMTDDACLYSKTCPWRGDPPTENCIADPAIPCIAP